MKIALMAARTISATVMASSTWLSRVVCGLASPDNP